MVTKLGFKSRSVIVSTLRKTMRLYLFWKNEQLEREDRNIKRKQVIRKAVKCSG